MANILILYNKTQTYTQTVYDYVQAFGKFSKHQYQYAHMSDTAVCSTQIEAFDAVGIHYSIRLPFDQISPSWEEALRKYKGQIFLFIQDEYDHTHRTWYWINRLAIGTVFTCVPQENIEKIYPPSEFDNVNFHNVLTGYVPDGVAKASKQVLPSKRETLVGFRGRPLSARYGRLGAEKTIIARMVKDYAQRNNQKVDIEWSEEKRIYGKDWYRFLGSVRSTLGTESGANVFDWDGTLDIRLQDSKKEHPNMDEPELLEEILKCDDIDGLMNQISPRIFEAISLHTALVLFAGNYSGILQAGKHYIELKKDGSNLDEVFAALNDTKKLDEMVRTAYEDIIGSGKFSYQSFVQYVDTKLELPQTLELVNPLQVGSTSRPVQFGQLFPFPLALREIRSTMDGLLWLNNILKHIVFFLSSSIANRLRYRVAEFLPIWARNILRRAVRRVLKI